MPCPDQSFYQELQALALICCMVVIPVIVTPQRPVALVRTCQHGRRPFELGVIPDEGEQPVLRDVKRVNWGGSLFFSNCSWGRFWPFLWLPFCPGWLFMAALPLWAVIITVCEAALILPFRVEYLSTHRYSSSMVAGGSRERDWKKGIVGPTLLRKFCRTASIL